MTEALILFVSIFGAISTYYFYNTLQQPPVRSSAFLSLIVAYLFFWFPDFFPKDIAESLPYVFMGSTFVGMTSSRITNINWIALSGLLFGVMILLLQDAFVGYGGKLGAIAFVSIITTLILHRCANCLIQGQKEKEEPRKET